MKTRLLGDIEVSKIGMGCMAFSHGYGKIPEESYSIEAMFLFLRLPVDFYQENAQVSECCPDSGL